MRVEIYVQARMGSTRLPGKVLKPVLGKPLLGYLIERLRQVKNAQAFVVLTTTQKADDEICAYCQAQGVAVFRGSEEDVLSRYYQAAVKRQPEAIVRITADCPLIDPDIVDQMIKTFQHLHDSGAYLSNGQSFPRGLDVEIFSFQTLATAHAHARDPWEREHVTPYIYRHPELFRLHDFKAPSPSARHRWTVDTIEDFELVKNILESLYPLNPQFRLADILALLERNPTWSQINAHIVQKTCPDSQT